jgi:ADP-ribose pyrophosphatase YjhB (NUDIX family)
MSSLSVLTARAIIRHNDSILLMERWRNNLHYFSIPGGHIEKDETPEKTVVREIDEETTLKIKVGNLVIDYRDSNISHLIYLGTYLEGEPSLPENSEEALHSTDTNRFQPQWVDIERLPNISMGYWQPLSKVLIHGLKYGFNETVEVVMAHVSR